MILCRIWLAAAPLAALLAAAPADAQQTVKITFVSGHAPIFTWSKSYVNTLLPAIDAHLAKDNKYKIDWNKAVGGALAKPGEELVAIQDGVADFGQSMSIFDPARMPLHSVAYSAPFQPSEPLISGYAVEAVQKKIPAMNAQWGKYNQTYLGGAIAADVFNIFSTKPIAKVEDLKGLKIGGAASVAPYIANTGAVHVHSAMIENYNNLKSGLIDGSILFITGAMPGKYYEVAKHVAVIGFGSPFAGGITVNNDSWKKWPQEVRDAVMVGIAAHEKGWAVDVKNEVAKGWEDIKKMPDVKIVTWPESERQKLAKLLPPLGKQWAEQMEKQGLPGRQVLAAYMDEVRARGFKFPRDWDKE
jgi:TRAP-type C4-dicarboxylate transport system substrate-binding protein